MNTKKYDCVMIPGGGLLPDGSLPDWTVARLEAALEIEKHADWIVTLSGGTVHKPPPLDEGGFPIFESRKSAQYLIQAGVSPSRILTEISSYDTIGNAYFARILFSDPMNLVRCLVITSVFHMPRCESIFNWIYSLTPLQGEYSLNFKTTPDLGLPPKILQARQKKELRALENLRQKIQAINSLSTFQYWFYAEHDAYSALREKEHLSEDELKSY